MKEGSSKLRVFLCLLLAVVVASALVAGVNAESRRGTGGRELPPEKEYRGGGGREVPPGEEYGGGERREVPPEEERRGGVGDPGWRRSPKSRRFILSDAKRVVRTEAGGMRVVKGVGGRFTEPPMHIGFLTMEPNSMFIPQYLDSSLILFVRKGEARIGSIYKDEFVEKDLKAGDLYRIEAGSAFYIVNTAQGQRLQIIASIDTSESLDWNAFESFYIAGGTNPTSVLAGFDSQTIATAFNVSYEEIGELLSSQQDGAIVYLNPDGQSQSRKSVWKKFLAQGKHERLAHMKRIVHTEQPEDNEEDGEKPKWSLRNLMGSLFGNDKLENKDKVGKSLDSYNIYDRKPDFRNDYGWSISVDKGDYKQLKKSDIGVYLVNLTAGSMMAPHVNPTATEYGIVLSGTGNIQIVYPNGTLAMNEEVTEGQVFWVPRYFPFCQVASRSGPFVFFGFSTSAHNNRPQFLVGEGSLLHTMLGSEFAAAFGMSEDRFRKIIDAQSASTILPLASASPGGGGDEAIPAGEGGDHSPERIAAVMEKVGLAMRMKKSSFAYNMARGFD